MSGRSLNESRKLDERDEREVPGQTGQVFMGYKMNMSYYTDSAMLQTMMEIPLEKKAGRLYAPPGKLQMIYFIDDLNMPALDKYNTQSAIELIKQKQDYSHWYDRAKIQVKACGFHGHGRGQSTLGWCGCEWMEF